MSQQSEVLIKLMLFAGLAIVSWFAVESINNHSWKKYGFKPIKNSYQYIMGFPPLFYLFLVLWMLLVNPSKSDSVDIGRAWGIFYIAIFLVMFGYISIKTNIWIGFLSTVVNSFVGIFVAIRRFFELIFGSEKGKKKNNAES